MIVITVTEKAEMGLLILVEAYPLKDQGYLEASLVTELEPYGGSA